MLDQSIPSLIMSFAVRAHAEQAMQRGRIFKEKPLQVSSSCSPHQVLSNNHLRLAISLQINWYIPNFVKQQLPSGDVVEEKAQLEEAVKSEPKEGEEAVEGEAGADVSLVVGENVAVKDELMDGGDSVKVEPQTEGDATVGGVEDELPSAADGDDELRLDDEEEEDLESEERSWRR